MPKPFVSMTVFLIAGITLLAACTNDASTPAGQTPIPRATKTLQFDTSPPVSPSDSSSLVNTAAQANPERFGGYNTNLNWLFKTGGQIRTKPTVSGDTVYVGSDGDLGTPGLYAISTETGEQTALPGKPRFNMYHPDMQEALLEAASDAGAVVHRGGRVQGIHRGDILTVIVSLDRRQQEFSARLLVGADGRASRTRDWGGFEVQKHPDVTFMAGILFDDMLSPEETSQSFRRYDRGTTALLFPQGNGRVRAYLGYPTTWGNQLSGGKDVQRFSELCVEAGAPAEYYENDIPAGPLASHNSAGRWVQSPYQDGVALIGDAAGATDPMWGQGLSLTVRDVRILRDQLLKYENWDEAGRAYAENHDKHFNVMNTVQSWFERLLIETGPEADARRAQALPLWREDASRRIDTFASGPDHPIDETLRRRFFGEE